MGAEDVKVNEKTDEEKRQERLRKQKQKQLQFQQQLKRKLPEDENIVEDGGGGFLTEEDPELWECLSLTQLEKSASDNPGKTEKQQPSICIEKSLSHGSTPKRQKRTLQDSLHSVSGMNPNVKTSMELNETRRSPRISRNKNNFQQISLNKNSVLQNPLNKNIVPQTSRGFHNRR